MTSAEAQRQVVEAAMTLRGQAYAPWREFVDALAHLEAAAALDVVQSHPDTVLTAQGRARGISEVIEIFRNVRQHAEAARKTP